MREVIDGQAETDVQAGDYIDRQQSLDHNHTRMHHFPKRIAALPGPQCTAL